MIRRCRWELRGSSGAYWVAFIAKNGLNVIGNAQQRYRHKRDALHSIEVVTFGDVVRASEVPEGQLAWPLALVYMYGFHVEVRDLTTKGASDADRG